MRLIEFLQSQLTMIDLGTERTNEPGPSISEEQAVTFHAQWR
jgi:hypothetical protein